MAWLRRKLLIWGKTSPEFSRKYYETVCTGAVDKDTGDLIRIYPITLRYLEARFRSYDWIEAEIERNPKDARPESFRIKQDSIATVGHIDAGKKGWPERQRWLLRGQNVFRSVEALRAVQRTDGTSLGLVQPKSIDRIYCKRLPDSAGKEWEEKRRLAVEQKDLFVDPESTVQDLRFMPVSYRIKCMSSPYPVLRARSESCMVFLERRTAWIELQSSARPRRSTTAIERRWVGATLMS